MTRELRKRSSRPNYATLAGLGDNQEPVAGPSTSKPRKTRATAARARSSSALDNDPDMDAEAEIDEDFVEEQAPPETEAEVVDSDRDKNQSVPGKKLRKPAQRKGRKSAVAALAAISAQTNANGGQLPLPNLHHRHRALPLFHREESVERLASQPRLFRAPETQSTNSGTTSDFVVGGRVNKSWSCNVGPGPLWELIEDRGWYKESLHDPGITESSRRPKVHIDVKVSDICETLQPEAGSAYLPSHDGINPSSSISCSFGPIDKQQKLQVAMFASLSMHTFFPGSKSHVFNAGAPAWGLDWCPIHSDERSGLGYKQYLAVSPLTSQTHNPVIGSRLTNPTHSCIQIWSLSPTQLPDNTSLDEDPGAMRCEIVVCIEAGSAFELKWCPLPAHDNLSAPFDPASPLRKLGILAGAFEDGTVSLYAIPDPTDITKRTGSANENQPVFVKLSEPLLRLQLEDTTAHCIDWANSDVLAVGCSNGWVAVYDVGHLLRTGESGLNKYVAPTHYFSIHQSAISSIAWIRVPVPSATGETTSDDPAVIATGGFDGCECVADIRDLSAYTLNRTRDVVNTVSFSTYCGGPVTTDHENTIKAYSLHSSMLGRGHRLLDPDGPIWSVSASDYHPQLAVGVADGSCMTTNTMRATRRGGSVPFLAHKIYQLDYSRKHKEYRMLEHFLPQETADQRSGAARPGSGAWPPEVGIQRVVWNMGNGMVGSPLLASATGSGLCRVDWLLGRWMRDRIPYDGIERMRHEVDAGDDMEEDSD